MFIFKRNFESRKIKFQKTKYLTAIIQNVKTFYHSSQTSKRYKPMLKYVSMLALRFS